MFFSLCTFVERAFVSLRCVCERECVCVCVRGVCVCVFFPLCTFVERAFVSLGCVCVCVCVCVETGCGDRPAKDEDLLSAVIH